MLDLDPEHRSTGPDYLVWIIQQPDKSWWVQEPESTQRGIMQPQNAKDIAIRFANFVGLHKGKKSQVRVKLLNGTEKVVWTYGLDEFPWKSASQISVV